MTAFGYFLRIPSRWTASRRRGADCIVPFVEWTAAEPPTLFGRPLGRNGELEVFAIRIWTERPDPGGTFAMFNPAVSCKYAK